MVQGGAGAVGAEGTAAAHPGIAGRAPAAWVGRCRQEVRVLSEQYVLQSRSGGARELRELGRGQAQIARFQRRQAGQLPSFDVLVGAETFDEELAPARRSKSRWLGVIEGSDHDVVDVVHDGREVLTPIADEGDLVDRRARSVGGNPLFHQRHQGLVVTLAVQRQIVAAVIEVEQQIGLVPGERPRAG